MHMEEVFTLRMRVVSLNLAGVIRKLIEGDGFRFAALSVLRIQHFPDPLWLYSFLRKKQDISYRTYRTTIYS